MDAHNYDSNWPVIERIAVRGIIFIDGKLLMIENSFGEAKLPGGGREGDEDDVRTLLREVEEETGYLVMPESIVPFGEVEERRRSTNEDKIWHQISRLYFCDVKAEEESELKSLLDELQKKLEGYDEELPKEEGNDCDDNQERQYNNNTNNVKQLYIGNNYNNSL